MSRQLASNDGAAVANSERWDLAELLTRPTSPRGDEPSTGFLQVRWMTARWTARPPERGGWPRGTPVLAVTAAVPARATGRPPKSLSESGVLRQNRCQGVGFHSRHRSRWTRV